MPAAGTLFVVATPIGHLQDLAPRALTVLREADLILAEDTRHAAKLAAHFAIKTPRLSLHAHNEIERLPAVLRKLSLGKRLALVSDAGTPGLCDPGAHLVAEVRRAGHRVVSVPGPSALTAAWAISGFTPPFVFAGFFPRKAADRKALWRSMRATGWPFVFFEAPHRLRATLTWLGELPPATEVFLAKELTKVHEFSWRGTAKELPDLIAGLDIRGEWVVMARGAAAQSSPWQEEVERLVEGGMPPGEAARVAKILRGVPKREAYRYASFVRAD